MSVFQRLSMIFKSKANKALDAAEDPRETLDYSYQKQLELLQKVRRGVADVATSRKRIELQIQQLEQKAAKLTNQGRAALAQGREDLAREALERKSALQPQLDSLHEQHAQLQSEEQKLTLAAQRLQAKVEAFRTRKETIKATYTAAQAQTQIQARAGAVDELLASGALDDLSGAPRDDIQAELDRMASTDAVERELEAMKRELGQGGNAPKQIEGGGA